MKYLVDSDQIIYYLEGIPAAIQLLQSLAPDGLAISAVSHAEMMAGVYGARDPSRSEAGYRALLRDVTILPFTEAIAEEYGRVRLDLRRRGLLIPVPDMLIGATALHHRLTLVTNNHKDFGRTKNLAWYNPWIPISRKAPWLTPSKMRQRRKYYISLILSRLLTSLTGSCPRCRRVSGRGGGISSRGAGAAERTARCLHGSFGRGRGGLARGAGT